MKKSRSEPEPAARSAFGVGLDPISQADALLAYSAPVAELSIRPMNSMRSMRLALANLDNGLYWEEPGRWTAVCSLGGRFSDSESVAEAAEENEVKNAAVAIVLGVPPKAVGFMWVTEPGADFSF